MICPPRLGHILQLAIMLRVIIVDTTQVCLFVSYWYWYLIYVGVHVCIMYCVWHGMDACNLLMSKVTVLSTKK